MKPVTFTINKENIANFIYEGDQYEEFHKNGKLHGNNGFYLKSKDLKNKINTYEGYGTIENPCKSKRTISIGHCEVMDGKFSTPQEIIDYVEKPSLNETHSVIIWDASEISPKN